ncbi:Cys-tRNA(Pro) deacylase [Insolitispirillum peregrinum]|uniref:Cys-tRNA(Pro) deacylase n=1 Tax=Insolitispirillum peregrinum TaxID=80876 RepID=UPI000971312F|nr:Cys-tRNA(Pro) deacylase [Insolitispirillum peregrinum]
MSKTTRGTQVLGKAKVAFTLHPYEYNPAGERVGLQAAEAMQADPQIVLKTLMAEVDGHPVCVVVPSDGEVSMKKLAAAFGGKSAQMMKPPDAERLTGYHVGGISPFGQKKRVPTVVESDALAHPLVYINGGQRGLLVRLAPADAVAVLGAVVASVMSEG